jgi:hypothetical protein
MRVNGDLTVPANKCSVVVMGQEFCFTWHWMEQSRVVGH